jgi:hypothetical protein
MHSIGGGGTCASPLASSSLSVVWTDTTYLSPTVPLHVVMMMIMMSGPCCTFEWGYM